MKSFRGGGKAVSNFDQRHRKREDGMTDSEYAERTLRIIRNTEKAFLAKFPDGKNHWVPKSCIADSHCISDGDMGVMRVAQWFVEKYGL